MLYKQIREPGCFGLEVVQLFVSSLECRLLSFSVYTEKKLGVETIFSQKLLTYHQQKQQVTLNCTCNFEIEKLKHFLINL